MDKNAYSTVDLSTRHGAQAGIKVRKRLCLFLMSLLIFMSTGCSLTTPQTPDAPVTEASENASDSTAAIESNGEDNFNTDASDTAADSIDNHSNITREDSYKDDQSAGFDNSSSSNSSEGSLTNDSSINSNGNDFGANVSNASILPEDGSYTSKEDVALYIHLYGHLPSNFITKKEAEALGWKGGSLEPYAPGKCIGGSRFGNYEELLPVKEGRSYTECDIDTLGADKRGAKRIVFSNDGLIYYTEDHYESFELLYGEADP